jgi:deoxyribose-phosphate aldolase
MTLDTSVKVPSDLAPYIDHTLLKADSTIGEVEKLCFEARQYSFKAVCVNPVHVRRTREFLSGSNVMTASVIGFPLGANLARMKAFETEFAIKDGAAEVDMVIRIDLIKEARWREAEADIAEVVNAAAGRTVKVILETGLLLPEQIIEACKVSEAAGAAFVKTATGFLGRGATIEDIILMRKACSMRVQIKASGGVKTFDQAMALIAAGANRLGTSSGVSLVSHKISESNTASNASLSDSAY